MSMDLMTLYHRLSFGTGWLDRYGGFTCNKTGADSVRERPGLLGDGHGCDGSKGEEIK